MIETKHGCVALLDALGTRAASVEATMAYLDSLKDIKVLVAEFSMAITDKERVGKKRHAYPGGDFRIRFLGDSILITLPFDPEHLNWVPVARIFSGVSSIIATGLMRGILFRGAIAVGEYVESDDAVLGPAVIDAAHWYEMPDFLGAIATPNAMFSIATILADKPAEEGSGDWPVGASESMGRLYEVPLKNGKTLKTHAADWTFSACVRSREASANIDKWFFSILQKFPVSPEVETKYSNTIAFLHHCRETRKSKRVK